MDYIKSIDMLTIHHITTKKIILKLYWPNHMYFNMQFQSNIFIYKLLLTPQDTIRMNRILALFLFPCITIV